ncbi:MAG: DMT family transporter [Alphaproteobacteria bacterium]|nr:DMT family transporter [Alphaproteobacteria bacterium SS10]
MPVAFVPLWATGFIGAKYGLPYAEPFTFLSLRYAFVIGLVCLAILWLKPSRLGRAEIGASLTIGILTHAGYLGAVFWAISIGLSAGIAAIIVGLQPIATALLAGMFLKERIGKRQWAGLGLGLLGVIAVLLPGLQAGVVEGINLTGVLACIFGLFAITLGTLVQRAKAQNVPLWSGAFYQYVGALLATLPFAILLETNEVTWTGEFVFALLWLSVVLSIGAISLLVLMLRHGAASKVATQFYLVPPVTAIIAYLMFDEQMTVIQLLGMAVAAAGVWLATRRRKA